MAMADNAKHCKRVNNEFKKSYDLPLNLLQYQKENSAEYLIWQWLILPSCVV